MKRRKVNRCKMNKIRREFSAFNETMKQKWNNLDAATRWRRWWKRRKLWVLATNEASACVLAWMWTITFKQFNTLHDRVDDDDDDMLFIAV